MNILDGHMYGNDRNAGDTVIKNNSFFLKLKYKQNHSLQGSIQWLEQKKTVYFRSLMELILLLQEAASEKIDFRSWDVSNGIIKEIQQMDKLTGSDSRRG